MHQIPQTLAIWAFDVKLTRPLIFWMIRVQDLGVSKFLGVARAASLSDQAEFGQEISAPIAIDTKLLA